MIERPLIHKTPDVPSGPPGNRTEAAQPQPGNLGKGRVFEYLKNVLNAPIYSTYFEAELAKMGLLSGLESAGIIPIVENPNPFDPQREKMQHERWWEEHLEEGEKWDQNIEKRQEILRYLCIGAILGRTFDENELFPEWKPFGSILSP